jgi:hypothetical protein
MQFWIEVTVTFDKKGRFLVEHKSISNQEEHFTIKGRNGEITLFSNRPLFRNKGLKKRRPDYKLIQGTISDRSFLEDVVNAIQRVMEPPPAPKKKPADQNTSYTPIPKRKDQFADRTLITLAERAKLREEQEHRDKGKGIA